MSGCLSVCLSACLSVCLSVCLSAVCLSVCLFVCQLELTPPTHAYCVRPLQVVPHREKHGTLATWRTDSYSRSQLQEKAYDTCHDPAFDFTPCVVNFCAGDAQGLDKKEV